MEVEDINAWLTRMDAERLLAQLQKRPYSEPSLVPPHAQARQLEVRLGGRQRAGAACKRYVHMRHGIRAGERLLGCAARSTGPGAAAGLSRTIG